jgi:hypothetical protein
VEAVKNNTMKNTNKKYAMGGAPCPDCKLTQDATGKYKYGSDSTGYTTSIDRNMAKQKHKQTYPKAYATPTPLTPTPVSKPDSIPAPAPPKMKKGGMTSKPKSSMKIMSRRAR